MPHEIGVLTHPFHRCKKGGSTKKSHLPSRIQAASGRSGILPTWLQVSLLPQSQASRQQEERQDRWTSAFLGICILFTGREPISPSVVADVVAAESCPTLCDHMDYSPKDSSAHAISQVRILEWVAISFSRGSFRPRDQTCVSCIDRQIPYHWATWESSISPILIIILKISGSKPGIISPHKGRIGCIWRHSWLSQSGRGLLLASTE